jgi:hypothetical protein
MKDFAQSEMQQHCPNTEILSNNAAKTRLYHVSSCAYCGLDGTSTHGPDGEYWHIDHVYPRSKGGLSVASNLVKACAFCNSSKGANYGAEWQPRRSAITAALEPWDWKNKTGHGQLIEHRLAFLEQSLEEHRIALDNLRQKIRIDILLRSVVKP